MADKVDDTELREAARARGFRLVKSRRRKPGDDFGRYGLAELGSGRECMGFGAEGLTATPDEVRAYLRGGEVASWKRSLIGVVAAGETPAAKPRRPAPKADAPKPAPPAARPKRAIEPALPPTPPALPPPPPPPPAPKPLTIRAATRRDAAALARLLDLPAASLAERLAAAIRADEPPILAERGGMIGVAAYTSFQTLQHGTRGRLTLLFVAEEERRQGLGTRLFEQAERRLADAGITSLELALHLDFDAPAAFLRRTGWQRTTNGYGKSL